jgi:hypothetical protein
VAAFSIAASDETKRKAFEDHQAALELFVEKLTQLSEMKLESIYVDRGEKAFRAHLRSLAFFTSSVVEYMGRMEAFCAS